MTKILVIGDIILDKYILGTVDRISPEAPIPILDVKEEFYRLGGAANVAANINTPDTTLLGIGGFNSFKIYQKLIKDKKFHSKVSLTNYDFITKTRVASTTHHYIVRIDNFSYYDGGFTNPAQLDEEISKANLVVLSDYCKGTVEPYINIINKYKKQIPFIVDSKSKDPRVIKDTTLFTPNTKELSYWVGNNFDKDIILNFMENYNIRYLLHTKSEHGAELHYRNGLTRNFPTTARQVYDVTGAGDVLTAKIAKLYAEGHNIEDSVSEAMYYAGKSVEEFGTYAN